MKLRVEVSRTITEEDQQVQKVRDGELKFGWLLNHEGHGSNSFYWVMDRQFVSHKLRANAGGWPISGKHFVRIDLDHPVQVADPEDILTLGMRIGFEPVAEGELADVWTPWDAVKVVRDVRHTRAVGDCVEGSLVEPSSDEPDVRLAALLIVDMIEDGTFPEDGVDRLRDNGWLTPEITDKLDEYGIKY